MSEKRRAGRFGALTVLLLALSLGLGGVLLWAIRHDFMAIRTKISNSALGASLKSQRQKVKAKAKAITLNHLKPSFDDFVAYRVNHGRADISRNYTIYYERLVEYMPQRPEAYALLGFCYYQTGKSQEAIASFISAMKLNPDFFWTPYNLGVIYFRQGRYQEAATMLRRAIALKPQVTLKTIFSSRIYGEIIRSVKDFDYAIEKNLQAGYRDAYRLLKLSQNLLNKTNSASPSTEGQEAPIQFF